MQPQDLDSTQCPAETLFLEAVEAERHEPLTVGTRHVDADMATRQHAQAGLRIFGDNIGIPSADLLQRAAPDEAHRAREDDRVAVRAGWHGDLEEVAVAVIETAQILVVGPVAIVLRRLDEGHFGVGEVSDHCPKPIRLDHLIRIHDTDDLALYMQPTSLLLQST